MQKIPSLLLAVLLLWGCNVQSPPTGADPVQTSLEYQPWESRPKSAGSAAYLGLGTNAKVLCSGVFVSKRLPEEAFANSSSIILDPQYLPDINYEIDTILKQVRVHLGDSITRSATYHGSQGCIIDAPSGLQFEPVQVQSSLPEAGSVDWPMGDRLTTNTEMYDQENLQKVIDKAFDPDALTAAFLVVHKGAIILEHYDNGANKDTQLESWSMGKSLTATLIGRLIQQGKLSLEQKAPIKEWAREGDPRGVITIKDLLQMSSGLSFSSHHDPEVKVPIAQLEHMFIYTEAINVFDFAVNRPLEFPIGSTGRYRNCDPLSLGYIFRQLVEADGQNYWTWPQKELFDKIGIREQILETDRFGNFIMTGFDYGTARNWGRLGMLYLQDGIWNGDRLLPEGFVDFVSTPAPAWEEPEYGGLFWLNEVDTYPALPKDAYAMRGGGGQNTIIVPSLDLVVVRQGHSLGGSHALASLNAALESLVEVLAVAR
ncbi:MAG: serine hydrolase [Bacteroidota bacterium]